MALIDLSRGAQPWLRGFMLMAALAVAGCSTPVRRAPVEDRPVTAGRPSASSDAPRIPPGAENAGKPGYYTVKQGDSLFRIATEHQQSWQNIARWNALDNPNVLEVGQVLRVVPPGANPAAVPTPTAPAMGAVVAGAGAASAAAGLNPDGTPVAQTRPVAPAGRVESRPIDPRTGMPLPAVTGTPAPTEGAAATPAPAATGDDDITFIWPATGPVLANYDDAKNIKGIAIGGKEGDPVIAAADGRVVYAGSGLRGYGNLVIVKHNNSFLTAYAHNRTLLVKDDQVVRRGQRIAEMGSSDSNRVNLHFEIRRQGKPIDPSKLLPAR